MKPNGVLCIIFVSVTLAVPAAPPLASAQVSDAPPAQAEPVALRKGFIVGIGGGGALHRVPEPNARASSATRSAFAGVADFKIGYAPTNHLLTYYSAKAAFTQAAGYDAVGISGVGVTYLTRRSSPSFFVSGIAGESARATLGSRDWGVGRGLGVGAGYEFRQHWSISGDALFLGLGGEDSHGVFLTTIGYLFY